MTFTTTNWDVAQTVTVKAGQDEDAVNAAATLTHAASGGDYVNVTKDLPVTVTDDDTAAIVLSETDLTLDGGRRRGVDLHGEVGHPADGQRQSVSISGHDGTDLTH